jgi:beta-ureidopropionase
MSTNPSPSRRSFMGSAGAGLAALTATGSTNAATPNTQDNSKIPGEIMVASLSLQKFRDHTSIKQRITELTRRMDRVAAYQPDIICLPEICHAAWILKDESKAEIAAIAEEVPGPFCEQFGKYAKEHQCYIICPIWTKKDGQVFNTAVLIGRDGNVVGEYHKIHPTEGEVDKNTQPGPMQPQVFQTDFGPIGIQICFDAIWPEGWSALKQAGARMVFWPSAYHGGRMLNAHALINKYHIVASTWQDMPRIVDMTGLDRQDLASEPNYAYGPNWICGTVNMEKQILHLDNQLKKLHEIQVQYGDQVRIIIHLPEDHATLESLSSDITVADIMRKYELITWDQYHQRATGAQDRARI